MLVDLARMATEVLPQTVSVLIVASLNARPRAVAAETAGGIGFGANAASALRDNGLFVQDLGTVIRAASDALVMNSTAHTAATHLILTSSKQTTTPR